MKNESYINQLKSLQRIKGQEHKIKASIPTPEKHPNEIDILTPQQSSATQARKGYMVGK